VYNLSLTLIIYFCQEPFCEATFREDPTILVTLLVRNKAHTLPYFLKLFEELDYPKQRMSLWYSIARAELNLILNIPITFEFNKKKCVIKLFCIYIIVNTINLTLMSVSYVLKHKYISIKLHENTNSGIGLNKNNLFRT